MSRRTHHDGSAWADFSARHGVGDVVEGHVVDVVPMGSFVRVGNVDGFAPRTSWDRPLQRGEVVRARIEAVDHDTRRFALVPVG